MHKTIRAVVLRGVFARKAPGEPVRPHAEGEILELSPTDFAELSGTNYVAAAPEPKKEEAKQDPKKAKP